MPQLDKITFLSQFFWLSFFYLGFYFLIYKYFLPKMSRTLKFRKRRINTSQEGVTNMGEESDKVTHSYQALLSTGLTTCKNVFNQNFKGAEDWLNNTVSQANQTRLKSTNTMYISSLGERSISQKLVISQAFAKLSERSVFALLISKFKPKSSKKENYSTHSAHSAESRDSTVAQKKQNSQLLKDSKVEKVSAVSPKSNVVEKQENSNKSKKNKDKEQNSGKVSESREKDSKTGSPKSSKSTNSKNKENKKK